MSMLSLVLKNLARRRVRTLLTVLGVAVGIGAVVSLTSLVRGFERSWEAVNRARGTDLIVIRGTSQSMLPTSFPESVEARVAALPEVEAAAGVVNEVMSIEEAPAVLVHGWKADAFLWRHLSLQRGRWPGADEQAVALGAIAAELLGKSVGDPIQVDTEEFRVCGIYESPAVSERTAIIMPLTRLQALTSRPGQMNLVNVKLRGDPDVARLRAARQALLGALGEGYRVYDASEAAQANIGLRLAKAISLATTVIASFVGAVGVMNTVLMSVFERLHEIGVLLAVGWRRRRIMVMILQESLLLSVFGAAAGVLIGLGSVRILLTTRALRGQMEMEAGWGLVGTVVLCALVVGALGGLYPAWRGARMVPTDALRHE